MEIDLSSNDEEEEESLIESFTGLTIQKEKLLVITSRPDRLTRLAQNMNIDKMTQMAKSDLLGFWFIALKNSHPQFLFRLYEMNQFLAHYNTLLVSPSKATGWLDKCLNQVYRDILVPLDETIFYPEQFIETNFSTINWDAYSEPNISIVAYFSQFVQNGTIGTSLFTRIIDPVNDRVILDDMRDRSLARHYERGRYRCISQYGNTANYTKAHVIDRASLFYAIVMLFKWFHQSYLASVDETGDTTRHDRDIALIRSVFSAIRAIADKGESVSVDYLFQVAEKLITVSLPASSRTLAIARMEANGLMRQKFYTAVQPGFDENLHYSVIFDDTIADQELRVNREKYRWLLPFNEQIFLERKRANHNELSDIKSELETIMIQESILWLNILIYESDLLIHHEKRPVIINKRTKGSRKRQIHDDNDEDMEEETNEKKKTRLGRSILVEQLDKTNLLSILQGTGVLSVYFSHNRCESYQINAGDNIQLPVDVKEYHIEYDEV